MTFVFDSGFKAVFLALGSGVALQLIFALVLACPRCGKSPYAIGPSIGPFAFAGKPIPDTKCSRCGFEFLAKATACNTSSETPPPKSL